MKLAGRVAAWLGEAHRRREALVGINRRNVLLVYPHNPRRHFPIADDKLLTKKYLERAGVPVPATVAVCPGLFAVRDIVATLLALEHFVVKPANGSGGAGILVLGERIEDGLWRCAGGGTVSAAQLERHLADIVFGAWSKTMEDQAFIECRVFPHPFFARLWSDALCDVRIITLRGEPLMSMIRVPTKESGGRANLHQGGMGIAVDLCSGRTARALHRGRAIAAHPETHVSLLDLEVPHWAEMLEVARRAAAAVPLGYLGVDVVLDRERGPLVLEINVRPGLEIQNVNGRGLGDAVRRAQR